MVWFSMVITLCTLQKASAEASAEFCGKGLWWWHSRLWDQLKDVQCQKEVSVNTPAFQSSLLDLSTTVHLSADGFDKMGV